MVTIYTNDLYNFMDVNADYIKEYLQENDEQINDKNIQGAALDMIDCDYNDLLSALNMYDNIADYSKILCIGSLGLWYGTRNGKKYFKSLASAIISLLENENTIFFKTKKSTIQLKAIHHDGTNNFKFYAIVKGIKQAIKLNDIINCY